MISSVSDHVLSIIHWTFPPHLWLAPTPSFSVSSLQPHSTCPARSPCSLLFSCPKPSLPISLKHWFFLFSKFLPSKTYTFLFSPFLLRRRRRKKKRQITSYIHHGPSMVCKPSHCSLHLYVRAFPSTSKPLSPLSI